MLLPTAECIPTPTLKYSLGLMRSLLSCLTGLSQPAGSKSTRRDRTRYEGLLSPGQRGGAAEGRRNDRGCTEPPCLSLETFPSVTWEVINQFF